MGSLILGFPNRIDGAVLWSSHAWQSTLPLGNLQKRQLGKVARTVGSLAHIPDVAIDLGEIVRVGAIAIVAHNLSASAQIAVSAYNDAGFATPVYASGWFYAWPAGVVPDALLEWEEDNFWLGTVSDQTRAGYRAPVVKVFPSLMARYWLIYLADPANSDGYVQVGRIFIGDTWAPSTNFSVGAQIGFEDRSVVQESLGGAEFFDERTRFRTQKLSLDWLTAEQAFSRYLALQRLVGETGEVLLVPDPDDSAYMPQRAHLARLLRLSPVERSTRGTFRCALEFKELL